MKRTSAAWETLSEYTCQGMCFVRLSLLPQVHTTQNITHLALYRPISKNKAWRVTEIIRREKVYDPVAAAEAAAMHVEQQTQQTGSPSRGFAASVLS